MKSINTFLIIGILFGISLVPITSVTIAHSASNDNNDKNKGDLIVIVKLK
jgi:hypothetical protein